MFKIIDTRTGKTVATNIENGAARIEWLNRKRIARRDWASFQMRETSN